MKFRVFDRATGKEADREKIGEEKWVKEAGLYRCHRADWFLDEEGGLYLCDPMEHIVYADEGRFEVRFEPDYNDLLTAARKTLEENRHLADGDTCTLKVLRDAVEGFCGVRVNKRKVKDEQ